MKNRSFRSCRFDILLLVLVVLAAGAYWYLSRSSESAPEALTLQELQADMVRNAERYADQAELQKTEYYNVDIRLEMNEVPSAYLAPMEEGMELFERYSGSALGTLQAYEVTNLEDDRCDAVLTFRIYVLSTKTDIRSPGDVTLKVGTNLALEDTAGAYLGEGQITWISH